MNTLQIKPAQVQDAPFISVLINSVAHYFTLHPQGVGAEAFLVSMSADAIANYIRDDGFRYVLARAEDGALAGVAALRQDDHLFHLFVSPAWQRQGVATQLWLHLKDWALAHGRGMKGFTVNATPYAAPFYARMGFKSCGEKVETRGVAFVPMQRNLEDVETSICPICHGPNGCEPARCGRSDVSCWCQQANFSDSLLSKVPEGLKGRACICARCVADQPQTVNTPE